MKELDPESSASLLGRFAREHDEGAFHGVVRRHLPLVYHAALRQLEGDHAAAQDVALGVFTDLAAKAQIVSTHPSLSGWLFTATRQRTLNVRRDESRRRHRESLAVQQMPAPNASNTVWTEVRPLLDEALADLPEADRAAVLGRYFEDEPHGLLGRRWGVSENAARMRVERAVGRLREALVRRGVTSTTAALAAALAGHAYCAELPPGLTEQIGARALVELGSSPAGVATTHLTGAWCTVRWGLGTAIGVALVAVVVVLKSDVGGWWGRSQIAVTSATPTDSGPAPSRGAIPVSPANPVGPVREEGAPRAGADAVGGITRNVLTLELRSASGQPVGDVVLKAQYYGPDGRGTLVTTNDVSGLARIEYPPNVEWLDINTVREGWADMALRWNIGRNDRIPEQLALVLDSGIRIGGLVTDPAGKGVPNVMISASARYGESDEKSVKPTLASSAESVGTWRLG